MFRQAIPSVLLGRFNIDYPIIQAGMVWCSGWRLAKAVSEAGGLGTIGAGSMSPEVLEEHLTKISSQTNLPYAVNLPLFYSRIEEQIQLLENFKVPIVITSAGSPKSYTDRLKSYGAYVIHVVSNLKFAQKSQEAGVDAVVAEGFEAGGHNGRDENTTWVLAELFKQNLDLPFFLAGGMYSGASLMAAKAFGAEGIQVGSRFACATESSAHVLFKKAVIDAQEGDTALTLKELMPVRLLKTAFYDAVQQAYKNKASKEDLIALLAKGRSKKGIFLGDLEEGELEIGQIAACIQAVENSAEVVESIVNDYQKILNEKNRF